MPKTEATHWVDGAAAEPHRSMATAACGLAAEQMISNWRGLRVTGDGLRATCHRCRIRWVEGPSARSQRPRVTLRLWATAPNRDVLPNDGVSRWATVGDRHFRVWPLAGRSRGWHVEEVTETGDTAGHPERRPHGLDWEWVGGFYTRVATLDDARETIAYLTDEGPNRATA